MKRLRQYCNMNIIEDKFHFLLACPAYRDIRTTFLPKYNCNWPT